MGLRSPIAAAMAGLAYVASAALPSRRHRFVTGASRAAERNCRCPNCEPMKASDIARDRIVVGVALAIALSATAYYGYLAWLLVSPD